MTEKNNKVPIAILSCFLIAFILQGVLKISGILVFEKALDWEIFTIIDNNKWLGIIYNSLLNLISIYCLTFSLSSKPYSKKFYHYILLFIATFGVITLRTFVNFSIRAHTIIDIIAFILIPFIIDVTNDDDNRLFKRDVNGIITTLSIHIILYFCYLGLGYWSNVLTSLIPIRPIWLTSSTHFLIRLEMYLGLVTIMLSANILISNIKRSNTMNLPLDIATDEAKKKELQEKKAKKNSKKNGK